MSDIVKSQVRLPCILYDEVKKIALEEGVSLNQFIIESLRQQTLKRACSPTKVKQALELITFAVEQSNYGKSNTKF